MSYSDYADWKNWKVEDFAKRSGSEDIFYQKEILPLLVGRSIQRASVFELGFGNGAFLGWARDKGFAASGAEVQEKLKVRGKAAGFTIVEDLAALEPETLDIAVAFDVFEHVPYDELIKICQQLHSALKSGSFLVARFPNGDSPFSLPIQNADATHVHSLGAGIVRELMRVCGFQVVALRAPTETPVSCVSKLALPVKRLMRAAFVAYVRFAFLGKATPSTYALNYLLVARKV